MHYFYAIITNHNAHYCENIQTYVFQPAIFTTFSVYIIAVKMMKKFICLVLTVILTCCITVSVFASFEDVAITDKVDARYAYTNKITSIVSISSKNATCQSTVQGSSKTVTKIVVKQTLQYKSGTKWLDVASWVETVNKSSVSFNNTKYNIGSGTYRVKTTADVYSGSKYETVTAYSKTASC